VCPHAGCGKIPLCRASWSKKPRTSEALLGASLTENGRTTESNKPILFVQRRETVNLKFGRERTNSRLTLGSSNGRCKAELGSVGFETTRWNLKPMTKKGTDKLKCTQDYAGMPAGIAWLQECRLTNLLGINYKKKIIGDKRQYFTILGWTSSDAVVRLVMRPRPHFDHSRDVHSPDMQVSPRF
jgi:hypothetical protein